MKNNNNNEEDVKQIIEVNNDNQEIAKRVFEMNDGNINPINKYVWRDKGSKKNHSFLLPPDIRAIVIEKSGFGKTSLLTYLLL